MTKETILLAGTPKTAVHVGTALLQAGYAIVGVLCPFPKPVGRKKVITACELEQWATQHNITVHHVNRDRLHEEHGKHSEHGEPVQNLPLLQEALPATDLLVVADFGYLIPPWLLRFPKHGSLNIHPSLLPRWRGATPVPFTILFGDKESGVTIIKMDEKFDTGAIVAQKKVEVFADDTTSLLLDRAFLVGSQTLVDVLDDYFAEKIAIVPQSGTSPTPITRRFTKEDGFIPYEVLQPLLLDERVETVTKPIAEPMKQGVPLLDEYHLPVDALAVERMIRALNPWPGSWTILPNEKRVKILETVVEQHLLRIKKCQIEGKNPQEGFAAR